MLQVLFVGRVKVSHSKVPPSFIDEACEAFSNKKKVSAKVSNWEGGAEQVLCALLVSELGMLLQHTVDSVNWLPSDQ